MILSEKEAIKQVNQLLESYPDLTIFESNEKIIRLKGSILVHRIINEFVLYKTYLVEICIPINSNELPYIVDIGNEINANYPHIYKDKSLCLETDSRLKIRFIDGFNLLEWMEEFVDPYFVSYEYFQLYGEFPLGERSHGTLGIIETYQDLFHTCSINETLNIMFHIRNFPYRGHHQCPCGSTLRFRSCHGKWAFSFYVNKQKNKIILDDLKTIERSINAARKN